MPKLRYRYTEARPNGLPPIRRTWKGISPYHGFCPIRPHQRLVLAQIEDGVEIWLIDSIDRLETLMEMFRTTDRDVTGYTVCRALAIWNPQKES